MSENTTLQQLDGKGGVIVAIKHEGHFKKVRF
jgi:hypothetical protein